MEDKEDKLLFAEYIGKSIIKHQFLYYKKNSLDDEELIPIIKSVINGISEQLIDLGFRKTEVNKVVNTLIQFCKYNYLVEWMKNIQKDENIDEVKNEGEKYFDYLFKYGKHPKWY